MRQLDPAKQLHHLLELLIGKHPDRTVYHLSEFRRSVQFSPIMHSLEIGDFYQIALRLQGHYVAVTRGLTVEYCDKRQAFVLYPRQQIETVELPA